MSEQEKKRLPLSKPDLEHLKKARVLEEMTRHEGWAIYQAVLEDKLREQELRLWNPTLNLNDLVASIDTKGAILALRLARDIVPGIIRVAKEIRERHLPGDET